MSKDQPLKNLRWYDGKLYRLVVGTDNILGIECCTPNSTGQYEFIYVDKSLCYLVYDTEITKKEKQNVKSRR